ncbi:MAG: YwiC-like family protein [Deltaproteobacteria bacterium]|nr:YwiC-like family protein [Deltaproteobacteria bacterium]
MSKYLSMTLPRQHGAWSILAACYILGLIGGAINGRSLLFALPVAAGFLARHTFSQFLRIKKPDVRKALLFPWLSLYAALSVLVPLFLIIYYGLWLLLPFGGILALLFAVSVILNRMRQEITVHGELTGIFGLSMIIPATIYAATGEMQKENIGLWFISFLFFSGSVFHVRYLVRSREALSSPLKERLKAGSASLVFYLASLIIVYVCGAYGIVVENAFATLIPVVLKAFYAVLRRYETPPSVRGIGFSELGHTIVFLALAAILL